MSYNVGSCGLFFDALAVTTYRVRKKKNSNGS